MDIELFNFLRKLIETEDGLILYALALIVIMEIVDFASGTFAAIVNPDVESKSLRDFYVTVIDSDVCFVA